MPSQGRREHPALTLVVSVGLGVAAALHLLGDLGDVGSLVVIELDERVVDEVSIGKVAANGTVPVTLRFTWPDTTARIEAVADADNGVRELREDDNTAALSMQSFEQIRPGSIPLGGIWAVLAVAMAGVLRPRREHR